MRLVEWLANFRALHAKAKASSLGAAEKKAYLLARDELARALLAAQRVQNRPGMSPRQMVRVSRALQADLEIGGAASVRATTIELSIGGFGALLAAAPPPGERARFSLRLPGGDRVDGAARVVGAVPSAGSARVSFSFDKLGADATERLELLIFDTVLEHLKPEP